MALVAADVLVGRRLQVDTVQRQAVERAEQLVLVVGVDALDHVKVGLARLAPGTHHHLAVACLEAKRAHGGAQMSKLALVLDRLGRATVKVAHLVAVLALAHRQLVGIAERDEARLAAQLIQLAVERYLVHHRAHLVADGALDLARLGPRVHPLDATRPRDLDVSVVRFRLGVLLELPETRLRAEVAERGALADGRHERARVRAHVLAALRAQLLALLEVVATARVAESLQLLADL